MTDYKLVLPLLLSLLSVTVSKLHETNGHNLLAPGFLSPIFLGGFLLPQV